MPRQFQTEKKKENSGSDICPNLVEWTDWVILSCRSGKNVYVPQVAELQRFCKNKNFGKCTYYCR